MLTLHNRSDFHSEAAAMMGIERGVAKNVVFGKLYGAGIQKMADTGGMSLEVAEYARKQMDKNMPQIKRLSDRLGDFARASGFMYTVFGRRRYIPDDKDYMALNTRIQGTCADIMKVLLPSVDQYIRSLHGMVSLLIHDEFLFFIPDVHRGNVDGVCRDLQEIVNTLPLKRTLALDFKVSEKSWKQKHKIEKKEVHT